MSGIVTSNVYFFINFYRTVSDKVLKKEEKQKIDVEANENKNEEEKVEEVPPKQKSWFGGKAKSSNSKSSNSAVDLKNTSKNPKEFNIIKRTATGSNGKITKK